MMYLKYAVLAPISFLFNMFCWLTAPLWGLLAAILKRRALPFPLNLVHTHDAPVWGDGSDDDQEGMPRSFLRRWWVATRWIMRNPGYTFDAWVCGFPHDEIASEDLWGDDTFDQGKSAVRRWRVRTDTGGRYFAYRRDFPLFGRWYIKMWFGWNYNELAGYHPIKIAFGPKRVKDD